MSILDELAKSTNIVYRRHYGDDEPTDLPRSDYFYDDFVYLEWLESDESLKRRIKKALDERRDNEK